MISVPPPPKGVRGPQVILRILLQVFEPISTRGNGDKLGDGEDESQIASSIRPTLTFTAEILVVAVRLLLVGPAQEKSVT
ncbi:hypothetical protein D3C87_1649070 [compost metagenome]